jgi:hypothetical protein
MCHKAVAELRKIGFRDDSTKPEWSTIQFFKVAQLLSKKSEIQFDELVTHPIFVNDPSPVLMMERAGLLSIIHSYGRPYLIKPNRPIFREAFKEMCSDSKLESFMGILTNKKLAADCTKKIQDYEQELEVINRILFEKGSQWGDIFDSNPLSIRRNFLTTQIGIQNQKAMDYEVKGDLCKKAVKLYE